MTKTLSVTIGAVLVTGSLLGSSAQASSGGVKVGVLTCNVSGGVGLILGSSKSLTCNYATNGKPGERYSGSITKVGVDIGYTKGGVIVWDVIAPASDLAPGALAGSYGGVTAGATVGVGLGANVLVGGSNKSIALQPISVEANKGLNIAAGIGGMSLTYNKG